MEILLKVDPNVSSSSARNGPNFANNAHFPFIDFALDLSSSRYAIFAKSNGTLELRDLNSISVQTHREEVARKKAFSIRSYLR